MSMWDMESRYVKAMEFARATFLKSAIRKTVWKVTNER